jgi:hypothetical protein
MVSLNGKYYDLYFKLNGGSGFRVLKYGKNKGQISGPISGSVLKV